MKGFFSFLILAVGLAACSNGSGDTGSQVTASVAEPEDNTASSGFSDSDIAAMRPETERSREVLWRLKGSTMERRLRN